ncbi:MAG: hypothetical protein WBM86_00210 [Waterburya sp.]
MNEKLQQIFQSYLIGRVKPLVKNENTDVILDKQKKTIMMAHLPLEHLICIKQITNAGQAGLAASFQGNLLDAEQAYTTANETIKTSQLNDEGSLVIKDNFNAAKGYFDYLQRNYESARVNLNISLEACIALINKYGYDFLDGRTIHLACNILKIEACSGNHEKAIKIACYLISNMKGNYNSSLYKDIDLLEPVQHLSFEDQYFLFTQVFGEVAKLLANCSDDESNELVTLAANLLEDGNLTSDKQFDREYTWFQNKKTLVKGKIIEFLEESSDFLAEGRSASKLLWHATVLDVLKICQNIDSEISRKLQRYITEDFSNYKYLPSILKA